MRLLEKFPAHLKTHFYNALYGGALGDALGFLVELKTPQDILEFSKKLSLDKEGCIKWIQALQPEDWMTHQKYESGQISDDTQLTLILAESLAQSGASKYRETFRKNLADAFQKSKVYSYGHTTKDVAQSYVSDWVKPLGSKTSTSNGSVMRIAPLGIYFSENLETVAREAYQHSADTHAHPVPCTASQAHALAIALLTQERKITSHQDKCHFIQEIAGYLSSQAEKDIYLQLMPLLEKSIQEAQDFILKLDAEQSAAMQNGGISMHAMTCVMWAHYCFLHTPKDYWKTITNALSIGGDVDTVASMTGSLSGMYNTECALPSWHRDWIKGF